MSDRMTDKPAIPNAVGRLDDFVEMIKHRETIKAAYVLDAEHDRRQDKVVALKKQLAREESACEEVGRTRKILSAMICYSTGMSDSDSLWAYPGWRDDFDRLSVACGGEPKEWFPEEGPADKPTTEAKLEFDERRVDFMRANFSLEFEAEVLVDIDTIDRVIDQLASISGNSQMITMSDTERKASQAHISDMRETSRALLEMQRAIINRVTRKDSGV